MNDDSKRVVSFNDKRKAKGLPALPYHDFCRDHAVRLVNATHEIGLPSVSFYVATERGAYIVSVDKAPTFEIDAYILSPEER